MDKTIIDLEDVLERVQDDWELLMELFEIFEQDFMEKRKILATLLAQKDFEKIRDVAHSIKGAAGNISAKAMFTICERLERIALQKNLDAINEILVLLDQQFPQLQQEIAELKKKSPG